MRSKRAMTVAATAAALGAALAIVAGMAGGSAAIAGEVVRVTISDLAFQPSEISVRVGDTVEWVNADFIDHTATATSGAWDVAIAAGKSARLEPATAGAFPYYCRVHPGMTGVLRVVGE